MIWSFAKKGRSVIAKYFNSIKNVMQPSICLMKHNTLNSKFNFKHIVFFSGPCPSSSEDLEGTLENVNALLRHAVSGLQVVNGSTKVKGLNKNRNVVRASACMKLPIIPFKFYCSAQGQSVQFQASYTVRQLRTSSVISGRIPIIRVSVINKRRANGDSECHIKGRWMVSQYPIK